MLVAALIILFLLICSAFFSGSETALMASSRAKLHKYAAKDADGANPRAQRVLGFLQKPEKLLATILLGNNLVNIAASAITTAMFLQLFGETGVVYATLVMTLLVLIFAEVLPKTIAANSPEKIGMAVSGMMLTIQKVLTPFTWAIGKITGFLLRCMGVKHAPLEGFSEDDVRGAIGLGNEAGVLEASEARMLHNVMNLDDLRVEDVMMPRSKIISLNMDAPLAELEKVLLTTPFTRLPVWRGHEQNMIGVLHVKDYFRARLNASEDTETPVETAIQLKNLLRPAYFVPETADIDDVLKDFRAERRHLALVVDEYGDLCGLLTLEDILEQIVGDIRDEHDAVGDQLRQLNDTTWLIDGHLPIRDANAALNISLPEEDAVTVAGFLVNHLNRVPLLKEEVQLEDGTTFEVTGRRAQTVTKIKVIKIQAETEETSVPSESP